MVSQKVTINNPQGLHMRPAGVFAKGMAKFDSDVTINFNGKATNGKSLPLHTIIKQSVMLTLKRRD